MSHEGSFRGGRGGRARARAGGPRRCCQEREVLPAVPPPVFGEKRGVFVTLTERGELRGCIGLPYPVMPLGQAIREAAVSAALQDPRFPPVEPGDLPKIRVEVTVLSVPSPLSGSPKERETCVRVGTHGLIAQGFGRSGLLLPQVATEDLLVCRRVPGPHVPQGRPAPRILEVARGGCPHLRGSDLP